VSPRLARPGEVIAIGGWADIPFVLHHDARFPNEDNTFSLVGTALVHGIMLGQAMRRFGERGYEKEGLFIV
jgi:hypothetical protein